VHSTVCGPAVGALDRVAIGRKDIAVWAIVESGVSGAHFSALIRSVDYRTPHRPAARLVRPLEWSSQRLPQRGAAIWESVETRLN
jgi:hypothetical protein